MGQLIAGIGEHIKYKPHLFNGELQPVGSLIPPNGWKVLQPEADIREYGGSFR